MRAVGLDETSSRRLGMATGRMVFLAFVVCSVMASLAGFFLAAQVQIGSPIIDNFALESIACAVLGGASLAGGRGSFVGTLLAALFLSLIDNVLPLFHQPTEYAADHHRRADPGGARALLRAPSFSPACGRAGPASAASRPVKKKRADAGRTGPAATRRRWPPEVRLSRADRPRGR